MPAVKELTINDVQGNVDVYLAYEPPIPGFQSGIAFYQADRIQRNSSVVITFAIDENGLIKIIGGEARNKGSVKVKLEPKIQQHINLTEEHLRVLADAEVKMHEQDKTT